MTADSDSVTSIIGQLDGANSIGDSSITSSESSSDVEDESFSDTEIDSDEEIEPDLTPIQLTPAKKPNRRKQKFLDASSLPLITLMNARSLNNKNINFKKFMNELGFEAAIILET